MTVADYIIRFLERKGVSTIFMLTGGQAMWLNDSVARSRVIHPVFVHHEQAAGMAAEAYGRIRGMPGVAMVTAGPATVNVLNGVVGAWVDSAPMLVISGQSALSNVTYMEKTGIRQLGLQGINTKSIASSMTKYFVTVDDPARIAYFLEKAFYEATHGRPGPVWIEVPLNVQGMTVPEKLLQHFDEPVTATKISDSVIRSVEQAITWLHHSKRPLWYVGQGVRLADASVLFTRILHATRVPVVTTRLGLDLVPNSDPLWAGRPGLYSDRHANIAIQTADLIISVGCRLDPGAIGYDAKDWGRHAKKVIVDIDQKELDKLSDIEGLKVCADVTVFLKEFLKRIPKSGLPDIRQWRSAVRTWVKKYPTVLPEYKKQHPVNSYYFSQRLSQLARPDATVVVDTSSPFHVVTQSWIIQRRQRFLTTGGISTMGYWPAAMGACIARGRKETILITGDGCLQMNVQELATVKQNKLPVKIFVINNNGYLLIRHTQTTHFNGRLIGESPKTGLWIPDLEKLAKAYELKFVRIRSVRELDKKLKEVLAYKGPVLCDVISPEWQPVIPRVSSQKMPDGSMVSKPFEDLYPFLPPKELQDILSITEGKHSGVTAPGRSDWG